MPKQISPIVKLKGTIDDISFYKTQDGFMAREKTGLDADRIKNDPRFRLTRLNGQEFGTAGKAGRVFREAWQNEIAKAADNRLTSRVTKLMVAILKTDPVNDYGERQVQFGNMSLLEGFEFNKNMLFGQVVKTPVETAINRATGRVTVTLPALTPQSDINAPNGTTHYSFFAAATGIDFSAGVLPVQRQSTASLPYDNNLTTTSTVQLDVEANSAFPLFLVVGIEFAIIVNGKVWSQSKGLNALQLAVVSLPV